MASYRLSQRADEDFESIYVFGLLNFGERQAEAYVDGMEARFDEIAAHPFMYPSIDSVRQGYRLSVYGTHSIYYRVDVDEVVIARILRNQNIGAALGASNR